MALIAMAVYDTVENDRTKYTKRTLDGLLKSVDWTKHRLIVSDNGSCDATLELYKSYNGWPNGFIIYNTINLGTAEAINMAWKHRLPGEHCIKIDNDIVINNCPDWADQLEECVRRDPNLGQIGLKRKDCIENVNHDNPFYKSKLRQLSHEPGERWIIVESQFHVMGSCVLHSAALLEKVGYLYQVGVYGFDDSFMSYRARVAKFDTAMLPHIDIDHIDAGDNPYQKQKEKLANDVWVAGKYQSELARFAAGDYYYNPFK